MLVAGKSKDGIAFVIFDKENCVPKAIICDDERFMELFSKLGANVVRTGQIVNLPGEEG